MNNRTKRSISGALALTAAYVGVWAELAPESFYRSFPGAGHHWVSTLGPYNEHLTRDVGGLYLALAAISLWVAVRPRPESFALVAAGWLAFSVPHFVFHMFHLDPGDATDKAGNIVALGGTVVLAALLLIPTSRISAAGDSAASDSVASDLVEGDSAASDSREGR